MHTAVNAGSLPKPGLDHWLPVFTALPQACTPMEMLLLRSYFLSCDSLPYRHLCHKLLPLKGMGRPAALTCRRMHRPWAVWSLQGEALAVLHLCSCCLILHSHEQAEGLSCTKHLWLPCICSIRPSTTCTIAPQHISNPAGHEALQRYAWHSHANSSKQRLPRVQRLQARAPSALLSMWTQHDGILAHSMQPYHHRLPGSF